MQEAFAQFNLPLLEEDAEELEEEGGLVVQEEEEDTTTTTIPATSVTAGGLSNLRR